MTAQAAGARVLELPVNLGVGSAMRARLRYAHRHGFDNVIQIASDGQHNPESVPPLLAALERKAVVIGARSAGAGASEASGPRQCAVRFLGFSPRPIAGTAACATAARDAASGLRASALRS
ncbi:glycosyltransferase, partial [Clavibacter michiganensis]|uniref:glycosyltransferase n=1 Tax=Clavibacter michiganensis TaxID=28447 RepID=UPI00374E0B47